MSLGLYVVVGLSCCKPLWYISLYPQTSREEVAELTRELESARRDHMTTVESLTTQWEGQLTEAREDYRRMKVH